MPLTAFIESLDEVSEAIREYYREAEDGSGYVLQVQAANGLSLEDTSGLRSALARQKSDADKWRQKARAFGDLDADDVKSKLDRLEELESADPSEENKAKFEAVKKDYERKLQLRDDQRAKERASMREQLRRNEALTGIAQHGISAKLSGLLMPALMERIRVEDSDEGDGFKTTILDDDGNPLLEVVDGKARNASVSYLLSQWKDDDVYSHAFPGSQNGGMGTSQPAPKREKATVNPFKAETENLTEQGRLIRENPELAKSLAAEAGVSLGID